MKKKTGFTLAEILGVIVILGLLLILIIPLLIKNLKKKEDIVQKIGNNLIIDATEQYMGEHSKQYLNGGTYCIKIQNLIDEGKLVSPVKDAVSGESLEEKTVKVEINMSGKATYTIVDSDNCENSIDNIPFTPGKITALFAPGEHTKDIGSAKQECEGEACEITFPSITSEDGYLFGGWSTVSEEKKSDLIPGKKLTITENMRYYGNSINGKPSFVQKGEGTVEITYPSGCVAPYKCTYKVGSGREIRVTSDTTTIQVGADATITAKATDNNNTATNTFNVTRSELYVASFGNDTTGYGTLASPYATINKAYASATNTKASTIYIMDNIVQENTIQMTDSKDTTLTSTDLSGTSKTVINKVTRSNTNNSQLIYHNKGTLSTKNITFEGNYISGDNSVFIQENATLNINSGTTINSFVSAALNGGAIHCDSTGASVNINGGTITNNSSPSGGAIFVGNKDKLTVTSGTISNNEANEHGGAILNQGTVSITTVTAHFNLAKEGGFIKNLSGGNLTINGGTYYENYVANHAGPGGVVSNYGTLTVNSGTFHDNDSGWGGVIYNGPTGTTTINNGTFKSNFAYGTTTSDDRGSGAVLFTSGTSYIKGGTFGGSENDANMANNHGGVVKNWGKCTVSGGTFSYNMAEDGGALASEGENSELTISGTVKIQHNDASADGGGVYAGANTTINLKGGTISYNDASSGLGGGIGNKASKATINITDGTISHNKGEAGGGIYIYENSKCTITGSYTSPSIHNNESYGNGGGIATNGTLKMSGGYIAGNEAAEDGGGVRIGSAGSFTLSNKGIIRKNEAETNGGIGKHSKGKYKAGGYVCKNNNPQNSYDKTDSSNSHCKKS